MDREIIDVFHWDWNQSAYKCTVTGIKEFLFDIKQTYNFDEISFKKVLNFLFICVQNHLFIKILSMYFLVFRIWVLNDLLIYRQFIKKLLLLKNKWLKGKFFLMISINVFLLNVCRILHPFWTYKYSKKRNKIPMSRELPLLLDKL